MEGKNIDSERKISGNFEVETFVKFHLFHLWFVDFFQNCEIKLNKTPFRYYLNPTNKKKRYFKHFLRRFRFFFFFQWDIRRFQFGANLQRIAIRRAISSILKKGGFSKRFPRRAGESRSMLFHSFALTGRPDKSARLPVSLHFIGFYSEGQKMDDGRRRRRRGFAEMRW